jgi:hypothetical protein
MLIGIVENSSSYGFVIFPISVVITTRWLEKASYTVFISINKFSFIIILITIFGDLVVDYGILNLFVD